MGSDNLFHERRARKAHELGRRKAKRSDYDRVLIVCEGEKTEPFYLRKLIDSLKLNTANVEVDGDSGSSPISVVKHAKKRYLEEKHNGNPFDRVFCVFDKDSHDSYDHALTEIEGLKPKGVFRAITSVPCFEYWVLLHYTYTTRPFDATAKSVCTNLIDYLKKNYLADYSKGDKRIYDIIQSETAKAITHSKRSIKQANKSGTDNPSTLMHELVEYLYQLKD